LSVRIFLEKGKNIVATAGNDDNYLSIGIVQEVYCKNLNINPILEIHNAEIMLHGRNSLWMLLNKFCDLMGFKFA